MLGSEATSNGFSVLCAPMVNSMAPAPVRTQFEQRFVALQTVLQLLQEQRQVEPLMNIALRFLQEECGYPAIWLALYDAPAAELVGKSGVTPSPSTILTQRFPVQPGDIFDQALITGLPATFPNLSKEHRAGKWQMLAQRFEIQGTLIQPICYRHQSLGVILVGSSLWGGQPRVEEMAQLSILAVALGNALYLLPREPQQQRLNAWHQSVLGALEQTAALSGLEERLDAIAHHTHELIAPHQTSVYWFEPEQRYFWHRTTLTSSPDGRTSAAKSTPLEFRAQEIEPFWQALQLGEVVAINEIEGAVSTNAPLPLMRKQQSRSLLGAPIVCQQQLLGFIAVAGNQPRLWQDHEKQYLQAAAQLLALAAPVTPVTTGTSSSSMPIQWVTPLLEAIPTPAVWQRQLKQVLAQWRQDFQAQWIILLHQDVNTGQFIVDDQSHSLKLRPLVDPLQTLSEVDKRMLANSDEPIAIANLSEDLRLLTWHQLLLKQGMRSLLLTRTQTASPLQIFALLGSDTPCAWSPDQCDHWQQVTQALGIVLQQRHLHLQHQQHQRLTTVAHDGLMALQRTSTAQEFATIALDTLVDLLQVPFAAFIRWQPGQSQGEVVGCTISSSESKIAIGTALDLAQDPLLNALLSPQGEATLQPLKVSELTAATQTWLQGTAIGQMLTLPLRTASTIQPLGAILLGDQVHRAWNPVDLEMTQQFVQTLSGLDLDTQTIQTLTQKTEDVDCLNWYKHRQLEQLYENLTASHQQLQDTLAQLVQPSTAHTPQRHLQQIQNALVPIADLIQKETWDLHLQADSVPLTTLLRRILNRVDPQVQARQLWIQVHNLTKNATLRGHHLKLELCLYELLLAACYRSPAGGRIDLWCRLANPDWLEIAITDHGHLNPQLVVALQHRQHRNWLAPSSLDQPPGRHYNACHHLVQKLGGRMQLTQLEDGRVLSRLMLPLERAENGERRAETTS